MSEAETSGANNVQKNWRENSKIHTGLQEIILPLATDFCTEFHDHIADIPQEERQEMLAATGNGYELPYGHITTLPPALFGDITRDTIQLQRELTVPSGPDSAEVRSQMIRGYIDWFHRETDKMTTGFWARPPESTLDEMLIRFAGEQYPEDKWRQAAFANQQALKDEDTHYLDVHRMNRKDNEITAYYQRGLLGRLHYRQHESYMLVMSKVEPEDAQVIGTRDYVQLPVGEYEKDATTKLAQVTVLLNDYVKSSDSMKEKLVQRLSDEDIALLREDTARTRDNYNHGVEDPAIHGVKSTLAEGILSIAQVLALLTANKVPGFDSHDELVRAILDTNLIEQFTRSVRPGYIGPTTLAGIYLPNALEHKDGKLKMSSLTREILTTERKNSVAKAAAEWLLYRESNGTTPRPTMLGMVCPAAAPHGALTATKELFKAFYPANT